MVSLATPSPTPAATRIEPAIIPLHATAYCEPCILCEGSALWVSMGSVELSLPVVCDRHRDEMARAAPNVWFQSAILAALLAIALLFAFGAP